MTDQLRRNDDVQILFGEPDPYFIDGSLLSPFRCYDCWPKTHTDRFRKAVYYHHVPSSLPSNNPILNLREIMIDLLKQKNDDKFWKNLNKILNSLTHHNLKNLSGDEERILAENLLIFLNYLLIGYYGCYAKTISINPVLDNQAEYEERKSKARKRNLESLLFAYQNLAEISDDDSNGSKKGIIAHIPPDAKILTPIRNSIHFVRTTGLGKNVNGDLSLTFQVAGNDTRQSFDEIINEYEFYPIGPDQGWRWMGGNRNTDRYMDDELNTMHEL